MHGTETKQTLDGFKLLRSYTAAVPDLKKNSVWGPVEDNTTWQS